MRIPSRLTELPHLRACVRHLAAELGFEPHEVHDIALCVHEAVSNAMVHGHGLEATQEVEVNLEATPQSLSITVRDQGSGFDGPAMLKDLSQRPPGESNRGRGLLLMARLMDEVHFSEGGRVITLVKYRRGGPGSTSPVNGGA